MERMKRKLENLKKMLRALERSVDKLQNHSDPDDIEFVQDSVVSRFKILIESTWKVIKVHLEEQQFADVPAAPKGVLFLAKEAKFLSQQEYDALSQFLSLRNVVSHIYDQPQYVLAADAAPRAVVLIKKLMERLEKA